MNNNIYIDRNISDLFLFPVLILLLSLVNFNTDSDINIGITLMSVLIGLSRLTRPFQSFLILDFDKIIFSNFFLRKPVVVPLTSVVDIYIEKNTRTPFLKVITQDKKKYFIYIANKLTLKLISRIKELQSSNCFKFYNSSYCDIMIYNGFRLNILILSIINILIFLILPRTWLLLTVCALQLLEFYESNCILTFSNNIINLSNFDRSENFSFNLNELKSLDILSIRGFPLSRCRFTLSDGSVVRFKVNSYKNLIELINTNSETQVPINFKWFNWFKFSIVKSRMIS